MSEMKAENRKATRKKVKFTDSIFFIIVIMMLLYVGVCSSGGVSEALIFIIENYMVRIIPFIGIILFTGLVKGNRFIISFPICRTIHLRQTGLHPFSGDPVVA